MDIKIINTRLRNKQFRLHSACSCRSGRQTFLHENRVGGSNCYARFIAVVWRWERRFAST